MRYLSVVLACAYLVTAAPSTTEVMASIAVDAYVWPEIVDVGVLPFKRSPDAGMTNQERIKRGLPVARPQRLYGEKRHGDLAKRINPEPSVVSTTAGTYKFSGCYNSYSYASGTASFPSSLSSSQAVQACANFAAVQGNNSNFIIKQNSNGYDCVAGTNPFSPVACTDNTVAYYNKS